MVQRTKDQFSRKWDPWFYFFSGIAGNVVIVGDNAGVWKTIDKCVEKKVGCRDSS
jgi:hypothetical protein